MNSARWNRFVSWFMGGSRYRLVDPVEVAGIFGFSLVLGGYVWFLLWAWT